MKTLELPSSREATGVVFKIRYNTYFFFFRSGLRVPIAYSLLGGGVPNP